jgi:hypothetical protein
MNKKTLILLVPLLCFMCGCDDDSPPVDGHNASDFASVSKDYSLTSAGVVVYGYGDSWIKNNSDSPVQIQLTRRHCGEDGCDKTKWVLTFGVGQVKQVDTDEHTLFHIYDMGGKPIGFIHPKGPIKRIN